MPENILVVEYEPRYTDRVKQALTGQALTAVFAKDGEEALRALDSASPNLIVISAVVPKVSATELIRNIRNRDVMKATPILLTVSGYNGKNPKQDALRVGASDILPKPYTEADFLGKVQQMLGLGAGSGVIPVAAPNIVAPTPAVDAAPAKKAVRPSDDVDKMLADTLAGVRPQKKREGTPTSPGNVAIPTSTQPGTTAVPKRTTAADLDKMLENTLSGLEKSVRRTSPGTVPVPQPAAPAAPVAAAPAPAPVPQQKTPPPAAVPPPPAAPVASAPAVSPASFDKVPASQPVFTQTSVAADEPEPTDGTKFGQYVLLEKIATGGMAEVWKARMRGVEGFQKIVAIKKILPHLSDNQDFIEMFIDEAKLAAQLTHNNIIHIYDLGKIQSSYYIAMEYVDGWDLKTILRRAEERDHPMQVELALFIASKIASALDYAHRRRDFDEKEMGLVHRDVSPQNVLISEEGDIKLCDFGIAKAASKASHTQAGALKGKLQYMSPEQAWGRNIDRRSDIFALATVLFEMLTSRKLFTGDNELSILEQVREARVTAPSQYNDEVAPEIDAIVLKALAKEPEQRYQTAGEMARDLDAILYNFRPTPTSADLAIYMHRLAAPVPVMPVMEPDEPEAVEPEPEPIVPPAPVRATPAPAPVAAAPAVMPMPSWEAAAPAAATSPFGAASAGEPEKKKNMMPLVAAAVLVAVLGGGAFFFMKSSPSAPATAATGTKAAVATAGMLPQTSSTATPAVATTGTVAALPGTATATQTALDPKLVDLEVQKRLAAERAKLEQAAKAQQTTTTAPAVAAAAPARPAPATATQAAQENPPAPVPAPVQQAPAPVQQVAETPRPAPTPAPAADQDGGGDAVAPRLLRRASVQYPAMARAQHVEGTVLCSVYVSETGQVLEVKIIRGIPRGMGLNEAADQMMRRSTFAPATQNGAKVKGWITVPVEFKL